jgi:hypothetical protein
VLVFFLMLACEEGALSKFHILELGVLFLIGVVFAGVQLAIVLLGN